MKTVLAFTIFLAGLALPADATDLERGAADYMRHCAACHGMAGKGKGPVSSWLVRQPPDLTRIVARNDGEFPDDWLAAMIDGRADVMVHGPREMPVWGLRFADPTLDGDGDGRRANDRILDLVAYIRTLQN